jgi:hypothetical protein
MNFQNRIEARDLYRMEIITDSEISPYGNYAVYSVQRVEKKQTKRNIPIFGWQMLKPLQ